MNFFFCCFRASPKWIIDSVKIEIDGYSHFYADSMRFESGNRFVNSAILFVWFYMENFGFERILGAGLHSDKSNEMFMGQMTDSEFNRNYDHF